MKKVLLTATVQCHIAQFHQPLIHMLKEQGAEVHVAAKDNLAEKGGLTINEADKVYDVPFARSPKSPDNIKAYKMLKRIIDDNKYDIIHCNTPMGGIVTRLAARKARKKGAKIIYTAHGFHFFKGAPILNWLLYYPAEWLCSYLTDVLITINNEDYKLAQNHMHAKRIEYVPGVGIDLDKFERQTVGKAEKRKELGISDSAVVLLSVGELIKRKNHVTVIRAIADSEMYYIIAGDGEKREELEELIKSLGVSDRVMLLGYRRDVDELYDAVDAFVFPSYQEGLPVSVMEAMASGLPCAVSNIRGNTDLIDPNIGITFDPHSVAECRGAIERILTIPAEELKRQNLEKIQLFGVKNVMTMLSKIYKEV